MSDSVLPKPAWIRARAPAGPRYEELTRLVRGLELHTVCEEAHCPNLGECWSRGTATFMILGDVCTRACSFCAVATGLPERPPDPEEPLRVAEAVARMGVRHAVVTSVNRDDRVDGGAASFAACIRAIRQRAPGCAVEVLIPDFKGNWDALSVVLDARPDVLNHNVETVPRLYRSVRPGARFARSLEVLARSRAAKLLTKSGIMVGLGEEPDELHDCMRSIHDAGADVLTIGQYLRPSMSHAAVARYYHPDEFAELQRLGTEIGFAHVESGPLVRSSYHAERHVPATRAGMLAPRDDHASPLSLRSPTASDAPAPAPSGTGLRPQDECAR
jgi:lipoyl synthase